MAQGADLLLHWCYRLDGVDASDEMKRLTPTPSEIAAMARHIGVKDLVLTHFRKHMDEPAPYDQAKQAASDIFSKPVRIAEDLDIFELSPDAVKNPDFPRLGHFSE